MSLPHELTADQIVDLLDDLDRRLAERGEAVAIFVVGGAAIAATGARQGRSTIDVDVLTGDGTTLAQAAATVARERGLPTEWLNTRASTWMPPLPAGVLDPPRRPGLRVTYADDGFLLATKLIAQRHRDADDIVALADRLGLGSATADQLAAHVYTYYTDRDSLDLIVDGHDAEREIPYLAADAARMLARAHVRGIHDRGSEPDGADEG